MGIAEIVLISHDLIIPQILDGTLPRTNSPLENLYGQIKRMLRKWSGSKQLLESFDWAAQLAAIRQSLKGTDLFIEFIGHISSYEWVEEVNNLASEMSIYRFQVRMANSIASKSPQGLVAMIRNLAIRDILG